MIGRVHLLPEDIPADGLVGGTAVVIDVLRATTTICYALAAGARCVWPCLEIDEAFALAQRLGRENCLLGGERGGVLIPGFDLGNSPSEYTPERVAGKEVVFTTTNGTRAMIASRSARRIVLAALVNRAAVCQEIAGDEQIDIICAGTNGFVTDEDVLTAGAIVARLQAEGHGDWNEAAQVAADIWRESRGEEDRQSLLAALWATRGGVNLTSLGFDADIEAAAELDSLEIVPAIATHDEPLRIVAYRTM